MACTINKAYGTKDAFVLCNSVSTLVLKQIVPTGKSEFQTDFVKHTDYRYEAVIQGKRKKILFRTYEQIGKPKKQFKPDFFILCDAYIEEVATNILHFFLQKVGFKDEIENEQQR